ncbi:hypothetical protein [Niabella ginsengisoli]|uniref:Uncharacterized protein n=1 Tax=Niabella ginsengisoli TaxID=522298 RepID=A0ABS9SI21_9BACT|nr:hypothetical protein [Niabella ginsengisoli]MCH5598028.1 hypothetical protein [Niabella ginsengisoli]
MYTSYIGKKFLNIYNNRNKTEFAAEQFFDEVFFGLFFTDESHLMHVGNSPFFQKPKEADVQTHGSKSLAQLANLKSNIQNDVPNMSIFVGASAKDIGGTTSGQVSSIAVDIDSDEMYASWIGEALAIGVNGGFVMLIDNENILWNLFKGWEVYRKYLSNTPNIKDKQIETWNGQWLCHTFSKRFNENRPEDGLDIEAENVQGKLAIPTIKWTTVVLTLSRKFPNSQMTAYTYNLSQMNTTLGFINLYLKEIHELYEMRDQLILESDKTILSDLDIAKFEPFYYFKDACALGTIGLKALEPAKLREFMPKGSVQFAQGKEYKFKDDESYFNYKLFKIWIYAMLNKTEIIQLADQLALILLKYEHAQKEDNRGKTGKSSDVKNIIESRFFKEFVENIKPVINEENSSEVEKIVQKSYLEITTDNFPLFLTLVRFQYQIHKTNS